VVASTLASVFALGSSCSLTRDGADECRSGAECVAAFGVGHVCAEDGFCEMAPPEPRCRSAFPADLLENPTAYRERVVLGAVVDESLDTQIARARAVELAIRDANEVGGLSDGTLFGLVVCDNGEAPGENEDTATRRVVRYLRDAVGVPVVVGPSSSAAVESAFDELDDVLLLSPSATSPALTELEPIPATDDAPGRLWRTAPSDECQARAIADDVVAREVRDLAIVAQRGLYGEELAAAVASALDREIETHFFATSAELASVTPVVAASSADEVLFVSSNTADASGFLEASLDVSGFDGKRFLLTDAAANSDLVRALADEPDLWERVRGTRPAAPEGPIYDAFLSRYVLTFGTSARDFSFSAHAHDAGWLALIAVAWARQNEGDLSARSLGRGLRSLSEGEEVLLQQSGWPDALEAVAAGTRIDVRGASGDLDFAVDTEEPTGSFAYWTLDDEGMIADAGRAELCQAAR